MSHLRPTLLLTRDFPPMGGGVSRWMAEFARFAEPGSLIVSTGRMEGSDPVDGRFPQRIDRVPVHVDRLRTTLGVWRWTRRVRALTVANDVPFIWCAHVKPAGYPARSILDRHGVPYGMIFHGTELLLLKEKISRSGWKLRTATRLIGGASALVANSRYTAGLVREVLDMLGLPERGDEVHVIPLGTDPAMFRPGLDTTEVRARYGLDGEGVWLMTVARLVAHKGIDTVLRALALLRHEHPNIRYAVIGEGQRRAAFEALARELGVADTVHFAGFVPDDDLPAVLDCADIYVHVPRRVEGMVEGFGIVISEASASGLPVITGNDGGMPDAVRDGETGIVLQDTEPETVARAIAGLVRDETHRRRLGEAGRRAVETYFNWERVTADLRRIQREAMARQGR
ncbi:MAG TPA: glycosyltransferase family 4 protein [Longimicrobiales bacterium]|nr:glycosyltransferase family 4 protein [Longimicrobiales bacterium]